MSTATRAGVRRSYADLSGGQMHYRTAGDGPPLLLLHPNGFSSELFLEVIPLLAERYTVIAPDRFAHGQSDPLPPDFPEYREGLEAESRAGRIEPYLMRTKLELLDTLGIDRAFVVGQHTGSHVALELALAHPERVRRLVLVAVTDWLTPREPTYTVPREWRGREAESPYLNIDRLQVARETLQWLEGSGDVSADGSHIVELWRTRAEQQAGPLTTPEIMQRITLMALECIDAWPKTSPQVMLYYHAGRRLANLRVPTLFLTGEHDKAGTFAPQQRALVPADVETDLAVVPGAGAFLALERPEELARCAAAFLGN